MSHDYEMVRIGSSAEKPSDTVVFSGNLEEVLRWGFCTTDRKDYLVWAGRKWMCSIDDFLSRHRDLASELEKELRPKQRED